VKEEKSRFRSSLEEECRREVRRRSSLSVKVEKHNPDSGKGAELPPPRDCDRDEGRFKPLSERMGRRDRRMNESQETRTGGETEFKKSSREDGKEMIVKKSILVLLLLTVVVLFFPLVAQTASSSGDSGEEREKIPVYNVVVTATGNETSLKDLGVTATVVGREEIERRGVSSLAELLRSVPSLDIVRTGGPGQVATLSIRGAKNEHTLVMIDGVEINDPMGTGRSADLATIAADDIERIEVVRGSQSPLYGSDAMAGVVNIITRKGAGSPKGFLSSEAGSMKSFRESAGFSGGGERFDYSLGVSRSDTEGISAASSAQGNSEKDGFGSTSLSGRLGYRALPNLEFSLTGRYTKSKVDMDNAGGQGGDDPNNRADTQLSSLRFETKWGLLGDRWEQRFALSWGENKREYRNDTDQAHPFDSDNSRYNGSHWKLEWRNNVRVLPGHTLSFGLEREEEKGDSLYASRSQWGPYEDIFPERDATTKALYLQDQVRVAEGIHLVAGLRLDDHERFGSRGTFRVALSAQLPWKGALMRGSYGTGFKAPSLYQLFSPYGSQELKAERSKGWELGAEQALFGDRFSLSVTYFRNRFEDLIDYDMVAWKYSNVAEALTRGMELSLSAAPAERVIVKASYVYTKSEDQNGLPLLRRPKHKYSLDLGWRFLDSASWNLTLIGVGERDDLVFIGGSSNRAALEGYLLVNTALSYDPLPSVRLFARIDNLLDKNYYEAWGYGTPGFSLYGGVRFSF